MTTTTTTMMVVVIMTMVRTIPPPTPSPHSIITINDDTTINITAAADGDDDDNDDAGDDNVSTDVDNDGDTARLLHRQYGGHLRRHEGPGGEQCRAWTGELRAWLASSLHLLVFVFLAEQHSGFFFF